MKTLEENQALVKQAPKTGEQTERDVLNELRAVCEFPVQIVVLRTHIEMARVLQQQSAQKK